MQKNSGFTLAEMLITLTVIGVVAALTLPALISNIHNNINHYQKKVIQRKFSQGIEAAQVRGALSAGFDKSIDFLNELEKDMKIIKICDSDHLLDCWPYNKIVLDDFGSTVDVAPQKQGNIAFMKFDGEWAETVSFILANGTPVLLSYQKNCFIDPDSRYEMNIDGLSQATSCLAAIYDLNGNKKPNRFGYDVIGINTSAFVKRGCVFKLPGESFCFASNLKVPTPVSAAECNKMKNSGKFGIKACYYNPEGWAGAVKECGHVDKLASPEHLEKLAQYLFDGSGTNSVQKNELPEPFKELKNDFIVWSNVSGDGTALKDAKTYTYYDKWKRPLNQPGVHHRVYTSFGAICVEN